MLTMSTYNPRLDAQYTRSYNKLVTLWQALSTHCVVTSARVGSPDWVAMSNFDDRFDALLVAQGYDLALVGPIGPDPAESERF